MQLVTRVAELSAVLLEHRRASRSLGLVPTMGALHAGHRSLIDRSRARDDVVALSIFVNPWQFNDATDFTHYPRTLDADLVTAEAAGVDVVFAPDVAEMYPGGEPVVWVDPGVFADGLEGASRPGHFAGVATVVAKLFALFSATRAYFGEKDFEQLTLVRRLALDLSFGVQIIACPTVREVDGLALSSRNSRLSAEQRAAAPVLYQALLAGRRALESGTTPEAASAEMRAVVASEPNCELVYAEVRDAVTLARPGSSTKARRLLLAATFGDVRLIDNLAAEEFSGGG
jgi:pantoate--beta-alanine ligase